MLHIITCATDSNKTYDLLNSSSISNLGINLTILPSWSGYADKLVFVKNHIKDLPLNDIVCFVDAYDVIALSNKEEILQKFYEYQTDLVISAELNCFPIEHKDLYISDTPTNYKYVNSGGYIGYVHALNKMLSWKPKHEMVEMSHALIGTDQNYVTKYYLENPDTVVLDHTCKIFQTMVCVSWDAFMIRDGRVINTVLKQTPCFLHFNGSSYFTKYKDSSIIPLIIKLIKDSKTTSNILYFNNYSQHFSPESIPRPQV